jgi:cobyrinic acid a,c-diamide synthase
VPDSVLSAWGERVAEWFDLDAILALARAALPLAESPTTDRTVAEAVGCRIGLAFDEAFHFYYEDNIRRLESLGAEIVRFSPVRDSRLPDVDGLYFGGGYPEVHAKALSQNTPMLKDVAAFAATGGPVYAECGGLMYLSTGIRTQGGHLYRMAGLIPGEAVMCERLQALGYVEVETQERSVLGPAGLRFRGHQFRYSELRGASDDLDLVYTVRRRRSGEVLREGYRAGSILASYVHAHWASNPLVAEGFLQACTSHGKRAR